MKLEQLIGEATEYDKKAMLEIKKPKSWLKSVSAFANGVGGVLIFGIADDDSVVGIDDVKKAMEVISEQIKVKMDPTPEVLLKAHLVDGKEIVTLEVYRGEETPYYYVGEGNYTAYVRIGNESVMATATDLKRLVLRGKNRTYDSLVTDYSFDDYSRMCLNQDKLDGIIINPYHKERSIVLNKDVIQHIRTIKEKNIKTYAKAKSYLKDRKRRQKYEIDYES